MFLTNQQAQIDGLGLYAPNFSAWAYVEHTLQRPWFYVATTELGEQADAFSMVMACSEPMLSSILGLHGVTVLVDSVLLVSPGHINKSEHWQMEPLERLDRYTSAATTVFVYHLCGGRRYVFGDESVLNSVVVQIDQIFSTSMIAVEG
jgi:hypothetical protein